MSEHRYLFSPLRIGPLTVRNRIVFSAHLTNYAQDGVPTDQHAAYYAARAAGGAGLIITEEHSTHPTDWPYEKLIHGFRPEVVPGYRRITEAVHAHDVPILAQLNHNGGQASSMYSRLPVWAPSAVPDPMFREVPKAIDVHEIAEVVAGYGTVAGHCADGGFDGVELQCSHSSIVRGFLSPATNVRTDAYGGPLANRARILLEIIDVVREAIGPDRALGVRLCGDELIEGGTTIDEAVEVARMVEATGKVDYINTSIGVATSTLYMIEASMTIPPGYALFISNAIRRAVDLPVVGVGRIKDPLQAERALEEGHCDLVGVVRGQIADPDFAGKARSGHRGDIRTCLSCNQECVGRMGLNRWLGCIENPRAGRESTPLPMPRLRKRVLVVGGGPAGLQAAATAAERGHHVTLFEREPSTGGQVAVAATVPSRAEFLDVVRNLRAECERFGADIKTNVAATAEMLRGERPDVVVLATGARPQPVHWAGGAERVVDVRDVLEGRAAPEGDVLVVDELGFHQAASVAELLADRCCRVQISTPGMVVCQDLGVTLDMETFNIRAHAKGIVQRTDEVVMSAAAEAGGVVLQILKHTTGNMSEERFDWIVCATHQAPEDELWQELKDAPFAVHRIGDCIAPRRAHAAVVEGHRLAVGL
ncbi:2,4-dienoyl-CoA reductase (NADPH2) [Saccharopolyspora kobensis]|uniref:2,4-dienoyl-CoA reductase (NADPH2) n=1 Tax=Saccharopolyspora kobensis TaxID=146035 RepID=A0A1H5VSU5_9PSEU|nr:mycofactocin system FadH/OYE family oxidoreductase 2 [Saccharopolyspora kobensis]SEF90395.1 2,4-dienoyl-CoA reductase (NADPH2) [Saccharopolyspora kobensis]SFC57361.1 2,4-dienoyl-CoA reductase (NADPH2) [Saccharopolyspora kobensis]